MKTKFSSRIKGVILYSIVVLIGVMAISKFSSVSDEIFPKDTTIGRMIHHEKIVKVHDGQGTYMELPKSMKRVVTLGVGTVDLYGDTRAIVATDGSLYMDTASDITSRVEPTVDSIRSYQPQLVVAPNTVSKGLVESLRASDIPVYVYRKEDALDGIVSAYKGLGKVTGLTNAGNTATNLMSETKKLVAPHKNDVSPSIALYSPNHGVYWSGLIRDIIETIHGTDAIGNDRMREAGVDLAYSNPISQYRKQHAVDITESFGGSKSELIKANPDVIFVPTRYAPKDADTTKQDILAVLNDPELQNVNAVKHRYVYPIDEQKLVSYTWYTYSVMNHMASWLYGPSTYSLVTKYESKPAQ